MKKIVLSLLLISFNIVYAQVEGNIKNAKTGENLADVNIIVEGKQSGTVSDKNGNFTLPATGDNEISLIFSHIGYKSGKTTVKQQDGSKAVLEIKLIPVSIPLGEIIVTSTKYEKIIRDIAMPVEAMDKEKIMTMQAVTAPDLLKTLPGLTLERDGIWSTSVNIRGMNKSSIVVLMDGNRIETATDHAATFSMIDLNDIERIEVIKGAASTLYGTGATGGVVNFISKPVQYSGSFTLGGSVSAGYNSVNDGSYENVIVRAANTFLAAKFTASVGNGNDIETPSGTIFNSGYKDKYFAGSVNINPLKNHELKLNYQNYDGEDIGIPGANLLFPSNAKVTYTSAQRNMASAEYIITNIFPSLSSISLKYFNQNIYRDVENIPYTVKRTGNKVVSVDKITPEGNHYTNGAQLQTNWVIGTSHLIAAGVDVWQRNIGSTREKYSTIKNYDSTGILISTINQVTGEKPLPDAYFRSLGVFAQDEITLIPKKLSLTVGARADQIKTSNDSVWNPVYINNNGVRMVNPPDSLLWSEHQTDEMSWSANVNLLYSLTENIDLTFNASRSFRSPSLEERYQFIDQGNLIKLGNPNLEAEKSNFFDLGVRVWSEQFSFRGNVFFNQVNGLVIEVPGTFEERAARIKSNAGKSSLYGFDLSAEAGIYKGNVIYFTSSYVRGKDVDNETDLPQIPPLNGRIGCRAPLFSVVNIDLSAAYFLKQDKIASGEIQTPGYVYWDLYLSSMPLNVQVATVNLTAGVENLFDKAYRNHLSTNRGLVTVEPGRNFFIKLNAAF